MKFENRPREEIRGNLLLALKEVSNQIHDKHTDAYKSYYPLMVPKIKKSIDIVAHSHYFTWAELIKVSQTLGFKRVFPLIELSEKIKELRKFVFPTQDKLIRSYLDWYVSKSTLRTISATHKKRITRYVLEGIFRKGLAENDREAWRPIMYNMGGRIIYDYIVAVMKGWLHEDIIALWLTKTLRDGGFKSVRIKRMAHDSNRVFKYTKKDQNITGEPDFEVMFSNGRHKCEIYVEVQHVTAASIKRNPTRVDVPEHRVHESKKYGKKYLFIVPHVDDQDRACEAAIIFGSLRCDKKGYVLAKFLNPEDVKSTLLKKLYKLSKTKNIKIVT